MSSRPVFIRNARASGLYEYFFVAAVVSVLLIRAFLASTHYPQLGPGGLHIAHMLYGGLLMSTALILAFSSLGHRTLSWSAWIGGAGFGFFVDELGKFITSDNNYFYRPTSVIIYVIFTGLFLLFRRINSNKTYTPIESAANAISLLEEIILQDLDGAEHKRLQELLNASDQNDPLISGLRDVVAAVPRSYIVQSRLSWLGRIRERTGEYITDILDTSRAQKIIITIFIVQAVLSWALLLAIVYHYYSSGHSLESIPDPRIAQLLSAALSIGLVVFGGIKLRKSRLEGLEYFRRALLIDLLITEPLVFYSEQFLAVFGLAFKLILWSSVLYLISAQRGETPHNKIMK